MKKVLMIFLSIALIFTMAAPAFAANGTVADKFAELKAAGILDGAGDAGSMPDVSGTMTREQLAKIAVNLAGLEPTPNVNIPAFAGDYKIGVWGFEQGWIQAAYNADLMKGKGAEGFVARGTVTIAELLTVVLRASGFGSELDNDNWKASAISVATAHGFITGTVNPDNLATYGDLVGQAYNAYQEIQQPSIAKVTPINPTKVEVKFSAKVDKESAQTAGNYTIDLVPATKAVLADDGVTVTLTFDSAETGYVTVGTTKKAVVKTFVIEPIVTADNDKVKTERYVANYAYNDTVKAEIVKIESATNSDKADTVKVTFSKPIKGYGVVKINGTEVYSTSITADTDKLVFTIKDLSLAADKTHTLTMANVVDFALEPNSANLTEEFTIKVDKVAPTALLIPAGDAEFMILFNKAMPAATVAAALGTAGTVKDELFGNLTFTAAAGAPITPQTADQLAFRIQLDLTANKNFYKDKDTRTVNVVLNHVDLKDTLGNKVVPTTLSTTLTKDSTAPELTNLEAVYVKKADTEGARATHVVADIGKLRGFKLTLSEGLANNGAAGPPPTGGYVINDLITIVNSKGGLEAPSTFSTGGFKNLVVTAAPGRDGAVYSLDLVTPKAITVTNADTYTVTFANKAFTDRAIAKNKSAATTFTVSTVAPATSAKTMTVTAVAQADPNVNTFKVTFSEKVKALAGSGSAYNLENYTLDGKALPSSTKITVGAGAAQNEVTIALQAGSVAANKAGVILTVSGVQSIDGVTVTSYTSAATLNMNDNTGPVLAKATVGDDGKLALNFGEIVTIEDITKVTLVDEDDALVATAATGSVSGQTVKVDTWAASYSFVGKDLSELTVKLAAATVKDLADNPNIVTSKAITDAYVTTPTIEIVQNGIAGNSSDYNIKVTNYTNLKAEGVTDVKVYVYDTTGLIDDETYAPSLTLGITAFAPTAGYKLPVGVVDAKKGTALADVFADTKPVYVTVAAIDADGNVAYSTQATGTYDKLGPTFGSAAIDATKKIVTITFNEDALNATADLAALKALVTFASDGSTFAALGANDSVAITAGKLVVTFDAALSTATNKIKIAANAIKDAKGNKNAEITTDAVNAS